MPPAPHQTVRAVFPHTAFRCSSSEGMRRNHPPRLLLGLPIQLPLQHPDVPGLLASRQSPHLPSLRLLEQSRVPSLRTRSALVSLNGTVNPSDSRASPGRFRRLIRPRCTHPPGAPSRVSSTTTLIFRHMPPLLPRKFPRGVVRLVNRADTDLPLLSTGSATSSLVSRLLLSSLALRPAALSPGNLRPRIAPTPLPRTTESHGHLPRRDFNPLDHCLLLHTDSP